LVEHQNLIFGIDVAYNMIIRSFEQSFDFFVLLIYIFLVETINTVDVEVQIRALKQVQWINADEIMIPLHPDFSRTSDFPDLGVNIENIESLVSTVANELAIFDLVPFDQQNHLVISFHFSDVTSITIIHRYVANHFEL